MAKQAPDPLKRDVAPEDVPLQSPMPRSPILDREEPELAQERDIPNDEAGPDDGKTE